MDARLVLVVICALLTLHNLVEADFLYNRITPKQQELEELGLKCLPGRTVIKMIEKKEESDAEEGYGSEDEETRRTHMRFTTNDESCQICVCSVEAKDEYCSRRPAMNVNECMRMAVVMKQFNKNAPFDHQRTLAYMIRRVGDGSTNAESQKCTPFVSVYSDCTNENRCGGCNKCTCTSTGTWNCETVTDGCEDQRDTEDEDMNAVDDQLINSALEEMMKEIKQKAVAAKKPQEKRYVPDPQPFSEPETVLVTTINKVPEWDDVNESDKELEPFVQEYLREKRSVKEKNADKKVNETITFHNTVDELNEDTLKNSNASGTIPAAKMDEVPLASRRSSPLINASTPLQIEYSSPLQSQHASDNKVDSSAIHDDQLDLLVHHKMYQLVGNESQAIRDKNLSKIVVNELKGGVTETIGDKESPVLSNITFTPENDTLTAMAFIAGNLLNKLWYIEKDSDDSLETEHMKHKKINDLLELFKEPLNLRQETFLKNALQQLSTAIENKSIENVSLCENIKDLKRTSSVTDIPQQKTSASKFDSHTDHEKESTDISKQTAATEALNKIGNVLDLLKKYEQTQNTLSDIKSQSKANFTIKKSIDKNAKNNDLTNAEKTTLNVFGNILESLTKLIIPNKKGKKITKGVKSKNLFSNNKDVIDRFPNLNLSEISLTTKDKLVLDYLSHVQNNPNCLLSKHQERPLLPEIKGDILLNLSDLFKIKSMQDLLNVVNSKNKKEESITTSKTTMTDKPLLENVDSSKIITRKTTTTTTTTTEKENDPKEVMTSFESTKEKLKGHLKTILEDLVELQNISGKSTKGKKFEVSEILPCIYNLINKNPLNNNMPAKYNSKIKLPEKVSTVSIDPVNRVSEILNNLKAELKNTAQTRRTNVENGKRPKSAVVWERTVKNMGIKNNIYSRRNIQSNDLKSFNDVKTIINNMGIHGSNTYKSIAYLAEVPASEQLLLLKTLDLDTSKYTSVLNDINKYIETVTTLPSDQYKIVTEFLENVNINLNLNGKIINKLNKRKKDLANREVRPPPISKLPAKEVEKSQPAYNTIKLSRDQIINQLIKNRMLYYLKLKEDSVDPKSEINIDLAKRILLYLEIGNDNLARELFKIFFSQKRKDYENDSSIPTSDSVKYELKQKLESRRIPQIPEPLIQFEESKQSQGPWLNQDQLMKQLINIKNMRD